MVAQARVTNKPLKKRATDVMINLTSPGDEELECVVGEESGQLESENHPWVSRNVVLFQIPERGCQNERVQYVEDQSSMNCTLISNCGKAFLMSGLTIHLGEDKEQQGEGQGQPVQLTKPHFRV